MARDFSLSWTTMECRGITVVDWMLLRPAGSVLCEGRILRVEETAARKRGGEILGSTSGGACAERAKRLGF
jgi:hypothetical protein